MYHKYYKMYTKVTKEKKNKSAILPSLNLIRNGHALTPRGRSGGRVYVLRTLTQNDNTAKSTRYHWLRAVTEDQLRLAA